MDGKPELLLSTLFSAHWRFLCKNAFDSFVFQDFASFDYRRSFIFFLLTYSESMY